MLSIFKSYPSVGDTALYHSLLPLFPELVQREFVNMLPVALLFKRDSITEPHFTDMRHPLFTVMAHLYTLLLLPIFHYLWLYAGSGNSNFYYASTLVWALANGLGVMDTFGAALKRRLLWELKREGHEIAKPDWQRPNENEWTIVNQ